MKKTFICNKIVRDKEESLLKERGITPEMHTLRRDEIVPYLKKKIVEEALEAQEATTAEDAINELIAVWEAGMAVSAALGYSRKKMWELFEKKRARKGAFEHHMCLCAITLSTDHPEYMHYAQRPEKYPERRHDHACCHKHSESCCIKSHDHE